MRAGTSRRVSLTGALASALLFAAPTPLHAQPTTEMAALGVVETATTDSGPDDGGNLSVTIGYVIYGTKLHFGSWPIHPGDRVSIRIDIWVAPNAGRARLELLKGDDVQLVDCSGLKLQTGRVNRIRCTLVVPSRTHDNYAHIHIRVETCHGTVQHRFRVPLRH